MNATTYSVDGLLARFRGWTAPELPAARERVRAELAAQAARRGDPARAASWRNAERQPRERGQERAA